MNVSRPADRDDVTDIQPNTINKDLSLVDDPETAPSRSWLC